MKKIKKVAVTPIEEKTGHIYDTTNIDNKAENTYSANIIDGLVNAKQNKLQKLGGSTSQTFTITFNSTYSFTLAFTSNGGLYIIILSNRSVSVTKINDKSDLTVTFVDNKTITIENVANANFSLLSATDFTIN